MVRNLYRFYLYTVFIALLVFATVVTSQLLEALLSHTPLHGLYGYVASSAETVQALVFAIVAWVIAGALGGLHYWLIRRDIKNDPAAGGSAIRSLFLNITETVAITIAVPLIGFSVFGGLGTDAGTDAASPLSYALPALALFVLLELERRRTEVRSGAALAFQRFHFYAVQIFLLSYLTYACFDTIKPLVDSLIFGGNVALAQCHSNGGTDCSHPNPLYLVASLLWVGAFWVWYGWLLRNDKARMLRLILHGASFAYGIGFILAGIFFGVELLIAPLFKLPVALENVIGQYSPQYDFISPLILGILIAGTYHFWLRRAAQQGLIDRGVQFLMESAIVAVLSAASFWWGCGYLLYNLFQMLMPDPNVPDAQSWVFAIAFVVAGLGYIPLDFYLQRRNVVDASVASGPRRGVVLALLGGGILTLAIGGAIALYAWMTAMFGSAIYNWQQVALSGLAAFIVGVFLTGIYLWFALREHLISGRNKQTTTAAVSPDASVNAVESSTSSTSIEAVLDELLTGKITREEAAERIRALGNVPVNTGNLV